MNDNNIISENMIDKDHIDIDYYKNVINDLCKRYISELYPDVNKITNNHLLAIVCHIYDVLFKPTKTTWLNLKCNIPYNEYNITSLLDIYIKLYNDYNCLPSLYSFSCLTGLDEGTIERYVTDVKYELTKNRREKVQGKLFDNPVGVVTLANNDIDTGLMYNRQNIVDHETVKQQLTLNDFVKISQKHDK